MKSVTESFFRNGIIVREEKTSHCASFDEAAKGLLYGKVTEVELDDGSVMVARTESRHVG